MTIARNLAFYGSWGINPFEFEPAASSPLWILLLAFVDRILGDRLLVPCLLAAIFSLLLLFTIERTLRPAIPSPVLRHLCATSIALLTPVSALMIVGMEHSLHSALALSLSWVAVSSIYRPQPASVAATGANVGPLESRTAAMATALAPVGLGLLSFLCTLARFESVSLVATLALIGCARRKWGIAIALTVGSGVAVAGYAIAATRAGGLWLPNSILLKTHLRHLLDSPDARRAFLLRLPNTFRVWRNAHILALLLASAWIAVRSRGPRRAECTAYRALLLATIPALLLQVQCGDVGSFFRYESWLVSLGLTGVVGALLTCERVLGDVGRKAWRRVGTLATVGVLTVLVGLLAVRMVRSISWAPLASRTIYEQQVQSGLLMRSEFAGRTVAVSDIGAVSYFGNCNVVDLAGLASNTVARATLAGTANSAWLSRLCAEKGVEIAVLYDIWLGRRGGIPRGWIPVGRWAIRDNFAAAGDTVTFYCTAPNALDRVRRGVKRYEPKLPSRVRISSATE